MMHQVDKRKLGVKTAHRKAMLSNMAVSLLLHGKVETTLTRAKELRRIADRLITLGKRGTIAAKRKAAINVNDKKALNMLFTDYADRFAARHGGYTRIYKLGFKHGDNSPMALIEYLQADKAFKKEEDVKKEAKEKKTTAKTTKPASVKKEAKSKTKAKENKEDKAETKRSLFCKKKRK